MKLLHREEVEEAGYDMPSTGICARISEFDLEELKYAGEWVLADDEVVVADGHQQQYLYIVASGQIDVYKRNDQSSQHQHLASIAVGEAFGEMAFLSGGVASADVQATGQVVLWRIDHERLLEFVGQHSAGGQLCLNIASTLSNRLVGGNSKLVDLGKKLQDSMRQLQTVAISGAQDNKTLRQMQRRVKGVTNAFAGKEISKPKLGGLGIAAMIVAGVSLVGLIIALATRPDGSTEEQVGLLTDEKASMARNLGKLKIDHTQLEQVRAKLQTRLDSAQDDQKELIALLNKNNSGVSQEILGKLAALENKSTKPNLPERPPSPTPPPETPPEKPPVNPTQPTPTSPVAPEGFDQHKKGVLAWARNWSTLAFPTPVTALKPFTLLAGGNSEVKVPVRAGSPVQALSFSGDQLVVSLMNSKTFTSTVAVDDTNYVKVITPRYKAHIQKLAEREANTPKEGSPFTHPPATNFPPLPKPPGSTNDHGSACVCQECRKKKKGGSLFPDL
ncbi:MAG: cyclic nucleotide-binding domain-containing protein [Opitutales bacterium]